MKSVPEMVRDCMDTADILKEHARNLEEFANFLTNFFVMPGAKHGHHAPPADPPAKRPVGRSPVNPPKASPGAKFDPELPPRKLSAQEKEGIRADFELLPPDLRTRENRRALAAKWRCSMTQVTTLTTEGITERMEKARDAQKLNRS